MPIFKKRTLFDKNQYIPFLDDLNCGRCKYFRVSKMKYNPCLDFIFYHSSNFKCELKTFISFYTTHSNSSLWFLHFHSESVHSSLGSLPDAVKRSSRRPCGRISGSRFVLARRQPTFKSD